MRKKNMEIMGGKELSDKKAPQSNETDLASCV